MTEKKENKGRNGELAVLGVLNDASLALGGIEPLRYSTTNTPDMGVDLVLTGSKSDLETVIGIGEGKFKDACEARALLEPDETRVKARFDVKKYDGGITLAAVDKFISEVSILGSYDYHVMAGSERMMPKAEEAWIAAKENLAEKGKHLHYINDQGLYQISQVFPHVPLTNPQDKLLPNDPSEEDKS